MLPVDNLIASSHHGAALGDVLSNTADLRLRQPSWTLNESPPRNFLTQIHWLQESFTIFSSLGSGTGVTEVNLAYSLSQFPATASIAGLFDQYCIYAVTQRSYVEEIGVATAPGLALGRIITAIDYDSTSNISTEGNINRFGSVQSATLQVGKSYERFVKPVVASVTGGSNSAAATGVAMQRAWINNTFPAVPHFGIRTMTNGNQTIGALSLTTVVTAVIGVRSNF